MTALEFNSQLIKQSESLRGFAYRLTNDHENARDLVQDTVVKAITNRDKFSQSSHLKAWLITIMKNTFINSYRRNTLKNIYNDEIKYLFDRKFNSTENMINTKQIYQAIKELGNEYRIPFEKHLAGYKYQEIAEELNLPMGTVKSRIFLARTKLSKLISL